VATEAFDAVAYAPAWVRPFVPAYVFPVALAVYLIPVALAWSRPQLFPRRHCPNWFIQVSGRAIARPASALRCARGGWHTGCLAQVAVVVVVAPPQMHNAILVVWSVYMCFGILSECIPKGYKPWGMPFNPAHTGVAHFFYHFYVSKFYEFMDTFIMIYRCAPPGRGPVYSVTGSWTPLSNDDSGTPRDDLRAARLTSPAAFSAHPCSPGARHARPAGQQAGCTPAPAPSPDGGRGPSAGWLTRARPPWPWQGQAGPGVLPSRLPPRGRALHMLPVRPPRPRWRSLAPHRLQLGRPHPDVQVGAAIPSWPGGGWARLAPPLPRLLS